MTRRAIATGLATVVLVAPAAAEAAPRAFTSDSPQRIECWMHANVRTLTPYPSFEPTGTEYAFRMGATQFTNCHPPGGVRIRSELELAGIPGTRSVLVTRTYPDSRGEAAGHDHVAVHPYVGPATLIASWRARLFNGRRWKPLAGEARELCHRTNKRRVLACTQERSI